MAKKTHLIDAYGMFWDRDDVDWTPGPGHSWQLLGRFGVNRGKLRICDFRSARGIYVLYNDHGPTYVGLARGQQGFGQRLVKHTLPPKRRPAEMRHAPKDWNRFSWFSFDDVRHKPPARDPSHPWCTLELDESSRALSVDDAVKELEALMIMSFGIRAQNQMHLQLGRKWEQVTWQDCYPGRPLTKIEREYVSSPSLVDALEQLND